MSGSASSDGSIDPEFIEMDELGSPFQPPEKPRRSWRWIFVVTGLAAALGYGWFAREKRASQPAAWAAGWTELIGCSKATSLEGRKELDLFDNRRAVLYDKSVKENGRYLMEIGLSTHQPNDMKSPLVV